MTIDVIIVGSGSAGLTAALTAASHGLKVLVLEKTDWIGGTSAMSGAGTWVPANRLAAEAGMPDTEAEALAYIRAALPKEWQPTMDPLWQSFVAAAPRMLERVLAKTPLRFALTEEPDPLAELPGGKLQGRMMSPRLISRRILGSHAGRVRRSTLPHCFTYQEMRDTGIGSRPVRAVLKNAPQLLWRLLTQQVGQGSALITGLLRGCLDLGCTVETGARVVELLQAPAEQDERGASAGARRVIGVRVEQNGQRREILANRGVVLASGGFEWDPVLRERWFPGPLDRIGSPRGNEGDGQRMAEAAGARLAQMDQANVYPTIPTRYEGQAHGLPFVFQAMKHAILVNRDGERFVNEGDYNVGEILDQRLADGSPRHLPAWVIADARFLQQSAPFRWYAAREAGWLRRAPSIAALAREIGVPEAGLSRTVARFNGFCANGRDDDFHRSESIWERFQSSGQSMLGAITEGPFCAMSFNRSILGTKGGLAVNARGEALDAEGQVIAGLLGAGNVIANPFGTRAVGAGTTIGPCMTWGFICGETLAGQAAGSAPDRSTRTPA